MAHRAQAAIPDLLREAALEGEVLLELVIDTLGHAEPPTVRVIETPHALFAAAARATILRAVYRPGRLAGHPVRTLVRQAVRFELRR